MKKLSMRSVAIAFVLSLSMLALFPLYAHAADGVLYIAVSSQEVSVGDEITVTLQARGSNEEAATADMEFTYNSQVFSFVSCNAEYSGGEGGKVITSGKDVSVKLKAVSSGDAGLKVTGSNGRLSDSQEALSNMAPAGVALSVSGTEGTDSKSVDNSLSDITLSAGELSPAFSYDIIDYTAVVPYDITSIDVTATPSNKGAVVEDIYGNQQLEVGENKVTITVKSESGARVVYTIMVTRLAEGAEMPEGSQAGEENQPDAAGTGPEGNSEEAENPDAALDGKDPSSSQGTLDEAGREEYEKQIATLQDAITKLEEKYNAQKSFFHKIIGILAAIAVVLLIVCVDLLVLGRRKKKEKEEPAFSQEEKKQKKEKKQKDVSLSGKLDIEEDWQDEEEIITDPFPPKKEKQLTPKTVQISQTASDILAEEEQTREEIEFIDLDDL